MKLRALLLLSVAAALPVHSAPPTLSTGGLGSSLRGSGPITSASGTMTVLPGAKSMRGLSFDAHSTASGGSSEGGRNPAPIQANNNNNGNATASSTRTRRSHSSLEIRLRNVASQADSARIEWFFVAKDEGSSSIYVWDSGEREVPVAAVGQARELVSSTDLVSSVTRTVTQTNVGTPQNPQIRSTSTDQKTGARPNGWIVRMFVDGQLARVQASSATLEQLGRDSDQLKGLVRKK